MEIFHHQKLFLHYFQKKILANNDKVILLNKVKEKKELGTSILLSGLTPGMSIHFAKCCLPIPGDDVLAFISEDQRAYNTPRYLRRFKKN